MNIQTADTNWEICHKLKELGFPQDPTILTGGIDGDIRGGFYIVARPGGTEYALRYMEKGEYDVAKLATPYHLILIKCPTEGEIISELGHEFQSIHQLPNGMVRAVARGAGDRRAVSALRHTARLALAIAYIRLKEPDDAQALQSQ